MSSRSKGKKRMAVSSRIPAKLNDGYTRVVHGTLIRPMLSSDRGRAFDLIRRGSVDQGVATVFENVVGGIPVDSHETPERKEIWRQIVEYPDEKADLQNLISGARLRMELPKAADMPCSTCRQYIINHDTWEVHQRGGIKTPRSGGELLCETEGGCPRGTWQNPLAFSERNTQAWNHYWEWKLAGMPFSECPIQRRNWMFLHWITEHGRTRKLRPAIRPTV